MTHTYQPPDKAWVCTFPRNSQIEALRGKSVPIELSEEPGVIPQGDYRKNISAHTILSTLYTAYLAAKEYNATRELRAIETVDSVTLSEHLQSPGKDNQPRSIFLIDVNGKESTCQLVVRDETNCYKIGLVIG